MYARFFVCWFICLFCFVCMTVLVYFFVCLVCFICSFCMDLVRVSVSLILCFISLSVVFCFVLLLLYFVCFVFFVWLGDEDAHFCATKRLACGWLPDWLVSCLVCLSSVWTGVWQDSCLISQTSVGPFLFFPALVTCLVVQSSIGQFSGWSLVLLVSSMVGQLPVIGGNCHQYNFCRDKHMFVATKHVFCRDKSMLVATKLLSRQTRAWQI